ncbi:general secretion pathway protein G [Candidatus Protochlamydia naegleriophila]|uniref:General secretion pathway protein G n=1 Tax=Candidatus Protochlamydia naegleriophila TaxID=389348 RepID=A0A0U5JA51_9BACT|nr:type II secretion system protein [Candidatus Protochlamydia naegleriophila]CUI15738.1 general secretion pathway protein G [Candidatus Protochlamydia naegleriophila]
MKKFACKKRFITLVEMMIVMFLIAMITGVIAYNYTGSLEEGKAFKTKAGIEKIHTILDLHLATHPEEKDNIDSNWKDIVDRSQLVKNAKELVKDGWGVEYKVTKDNEGEIEIVSDKYNAYLSKKGQGTLFNKEAS